MSERLNKTSICSVVFLDIVNQSKKPVAEQIRDKDLFNGFINEAIKDVAQNDRILLDTGDGAAIALLGAPEEALFVAMTIRDSILRHNNEHEQKLYVRTGINLGPVRVVSDINGRPNILGDGINVAERVMSFSEPNQILVSRSYYEITSRLTEEITGMFAYFGIRQDKHIREHEVYLIRSPEDEAAPAVAMESSAAAKQKQAPAWLAAMLNNENLSRYLLWAGGALVVVAVSISGFMLAGNLLSPGLGNVVAESEPAPSFTTTAASAKLSEAGKQTAALPVKESKPTAVSESNNASAKQVAAAKPAASDKDTAASKPSRRKTSTVKKKEVEPAPAPVQEEAPTVASSTPVHHDSASQETHEAKSAANEKSGWSAFKESLKQGREQKVCTQAEIALNQCK